LIIQSGVYPRFDQECIPDCGQICQGCCLYIANELCPPCLPDGTRQAAQCYLLWVDMREGNQSPGCEDCCEEQIEEGYDRCMCPCHVYIDGELVEVRQCSGTCAGHGCFPKSRRGNAQPVYFYDDKCFVVKQAPNAYGEVVACGFNPCGLIDEIPPDFECQTPWDWINNACQTSQGGTSGEECFVRAMPWCEWAGEFVGYNDFGDNNEVEEICNCPPDDCDPEPPEDCCDWGQNCPAEFLQCCEDEDTGDCRCLPRYDQEGNEIDCEGNPGGGPCTLEGDCCDAGQGLHTITIAMDFKSAFEYGGECACSGGKEDSWPECYGTTTYEYQFGSASDNPYEDSPGQAEFVCGASDTERWLSCSDSDNCGALPSMPGYTPLNSPTQKSIPNCDAIDDSCCPQSNCDGKKRVTDYIECGQPPGDIPWCDPGDLENCPKGCSMYGNMHLGLELEVKSITFCSASNGPNYFQVYEAGSIEVPRIVLGHYCNGSNNTGNCPLPTCRHGGVPGAAPVSWSIGTSGKVEVPGEWVGELIFTPSPSDPCIGNVLINLAFFPTDTSLNSLFWSRTLYAVDHPCRGGATSDAYLNFAYVVQQNNGWITGPAQAIAVMENCGVSPPAGCEPDGAVFTEIMAEYNANGQIIFNALELNSVSSLMQGSINAYGVGEEYRVSGFTGCDLSRASPGHPCGLCGGNTTSVNCGGWTVGKIFSQLTMGYT